MTDLRGVSVEEAEIERLTNMVISEVSLGTEVIDVLSDDNFGLMFESNFNASNEFTTAVMVNMYTNNIMCVGTSSSRRSSEINNEMVQSRWGIHPTLAKNMVEYTTQQGVRI